MEQKLFKLLVHENEIGWKSILVSLVKQEGMSPWDVDIAQLTSRYVERLKQMKDSDLKVSGKVVLAAAILLGIKSKRLVGEDLTEFDRLMSSAEEDNFYDSLEQELKQKEAIDLPDEAFQLNPRFPQPRRRKVSIFELVSALEKALEVKQRRENRLQVGANVGIPERKFDITTAMNSIWGRIKTFFMRSEKLTFSKLVKDKTKEGRVYTLIPLLHLSNEQKVYLQQDKLFGEITISENDNSRRKAIPEESG